MEEKVRDQKKQALVVAAAVLLILLGFVSSVSCKLYQERFVRQEQVNQAFLSYLGDMRIGHEIEWLEGVMFKKECQTERDSLLKAEGLLSSASYKAYDADTDGEFSASLWLIDDYLKMWSESGDMPKKDMLVQLQAYYDAVLENIDDRESGAKAIHALYSYLMEIMEE